MNGYNRNHPFITFRSNRNITDKIITKKYTIRIHNLAAKKH